MIQLILLISHEECEVDGVEAAELEAGEDMCHPRCMNHRASIYCTRSNRGGNGGGLVQSRCMNHGASVERGYLGSHMCCIRGSSYSRYVRAELWSPS